MLLKSQHLETTLTIADVMLLAAKGIQCSVSVEMH